MYCHSYLRKKTLNPVANCLHSRSAILKLFEKKSFQWDYKVNRSDTNNNIQTAGICDCRCRLLLAICALHNHNRDQAILDPINTFLSYDDKGVLEMAERLMTKGYLYLL